MSAPRVAIERTLLNSTAEAISRCPCLYWTAKITAATGAGRALVRTARRRGNITGFRVQVPLGHVIYAFDQRLSISKVRWQRKFPVHGRASSNLSRTRTLWARCDVACLAADRAKARRSAMPYGRVLLLFARPHRAIQAVLGGPGLRPLKLGLAWISGGLELPRSQGRVPPMDPGQPDPGRPRSADGRIGLHAVTRKALCGGP